MILDSVANLLPGLMPASFRGVGFFVPDTSTEVGRRTLETLFPGIDRAAYDDFGRHPADVSVEGIMVGDDYIAQAKALAAAFERAGPGTLMHPWLGGMTVILIEPAEISFSASELRVARFLARFKRINTGGGKIAVGTASAMLSSATALAAAALGFVQAAMSTLSSTRTLATVQSWRSVSAAWSIGSALGGAPIGSFPVARSDAAARITAILSKPLSVAAPGEPLSYGVQIAAITSALTASIASSAMVPAVAPAAESPAPIAAVEPLAALDLCLSVAGRLVATEASSETDRALLVCAALDATAAACTLSVWCCYASRDHAVAIRNILAGSISSLVTAISDLQRGPYAAVASSAGRAATELKARVTADLNEVIGRLPSVIVFDTDRDVDAFDLANHVYGDDPEKIEAGYRSIVARNRPRHPSQLPAGRIEVLR